MNKILNCFFDCLNENEPSSINFFQENRIDPNSKYVVCGIVFAAINKSYFDLAKLIVSDDLFNANDAIDVLGEPLICKVAWSIPGAKDAKLVEKYYDFIRFCIKSGKFDLNVKDTNLDSVVNILAQWSTSEEFKMLIANPNVNLNLVNDIECTALTNALRFDRVENVKLLAARGDLIVRPIDVVIADKHNIDLQTFGYKVPNVTDSERQFYS